MHCLDLDGLGFILTNIKKTPVKDAVAGGKAGSPAAGEVPAAGGAPVTAQCLISLATPCMPLDDWPCCYHSEPAVLQATFSTDRLQNRCQNGTLTMAAEGPSLAVSLVTWQQPRPASVPWEYGADRVPCNDWRSVGLEPAEQSRTNMLQRSALKIYLMARNLGLAHTQPRGARALCPQSEPQNMGSGAKLHTLLELNLLSGGIGTRGRTACAAGSLSLPMAMHSASRKSLVL